MSDLSLAIKLSTEGGQIVVKELTQIGQAAGVTNRDLEKTGPAGDAASKGLAVTAASAATLNSHLMMLMRTVGLVAGGLGAFALIDRSDEWGQYAARIRNATQSADEYNYVQQRMVSSANDTFRAITETKESFIQMSPILRDMGYRLNQSIDIVDSFSSLLVVNAARADRAAAAQSALASSIQRGGVDADSWKTIFGTMPTILDNLTTATGKTASEIRELGITGKLSITDLTNALLLSYEENRKAVEAMPTTVRDALQSFSTVFTEYIGWQNEAKGVTAGMADGIVFLADHFDTLVNIVGGVAVAAFVNYAAQAAIATKVTLGKYAANVALTAQELRLAQAQVEQTKATLVQAAMMARTTGAHGQASVAAEAYRAATLRLTQAQAAQVTVGRTLLGVLGGPVGLALTAGLAATAFFTFADAGNDVRAAIDDLQQPLDSLLEKYQRLTQDQRSVAMLKWLEAEQEAAKEANRAYADLTKTLFSYRGAFEQLTPERFQLIDQLRKAKEEGTALTPILQAAGKAAGVPESEINKWIKLAGTYADAKAQADQAAKSIKAVTDAAKEPLGLDKLLSGDLFGFNTLPIAENKELEKALLGVYNAQMLNANAVDAYGAALTGIDLELFKASFVSATKLPADATEQVRRFAAEAKAAAANLNLDQYLKQLQQEAGLLNARLGMTEKEFEIKKAMAAFTGPDFLGADPARLATIEAEMRLVQQRNLLVADRTTLASLTKENDLLMVRLAQGEKEYEVQKALAALKGKDPAVLAAIEAELRLRQQLNEKITISEEIASSAFKRTLDDMTALSSAGQSFGDVLTQAFGRVAQQIDGMTAAQVNYNRQLEDLAKKRKEVERLETNSPKRAAALLDIQRTEARLGREHFQAQIGQYAALTGAAAQMFSTQSKERAALHKIEMAFSAVEMAMAMQRAAANALAAIANQGNGDPYTAFARIAAMAAIMAGLGLFSGSVSGGANIAAERQASQGTGTVLGSDDKSASITNALDRIADLSLDQYSELRAINSSIKALSSGIANLAVSLVSSYGRFNESSYSGQLGTDKQFQLNGGLASIVALGPLGGAVDQLLGGFVGNIFNSILGGISKTTRNLVDSGLSFQTQQIGEILATGLLEGSYYNVIETTKRKLWGLSKKTSQSTEYMALDNALEAEFGRIFTFLATSITSAVDLLGLDINKSLANFVINLPNISFKDLSGDEIQKELEAIFSQQADLMVQYLVPSIAQYQKMGEGLYDTLIRVAQEQAIFNAQIDALGLQLSRFGNVTAETQIAIAQSIIELMGGIEQFRDLTGQYFSAFYSESEQFEFLSRSLSQAFADLGLALPDARESFRGLVDSIDITTEAGQALFAQLMQLVPGLDEYYKALQQQQEAAEKAAEAERKLAAERNKFDSNINNELIRMDFSPFQLAMDDLNKWYIDAKADAEALGASTALLAQLYDKKRDALATEYMDRSIANAENAMRTLVSDYQRTVEQLGNALAQTIDSIGAMVGNIGNDILALRKTLPEFNAVAYYATQVNSLSAQLGTGTATEQLAVISRLRAAMLDRYNAELDALAKNVQALEAEHALKEELYQIQLQQFNALKDAALAMKDAAAALLYSDLSTLTAGERLQQLQSQYNEQVAKARGGDAEAYAQVKRLGEQLLQMSRDYDPANYGAVFDSVLGTFNELGNIAIAEPIAPAPHPAIAAYEQTKIALARQMIEQLEALAGTTQSLEVLATNENTAALTALTAQFNAATADVNAQLELELAAIRAEMPAQTDAIVEALHQLDLSVREGVDRTGDVVDSLAVSNDNLNTIAVLTSATPPPVVVPAPTVYVNVTYTPPPSEPVAPTLPNAVTELQTLQQISLATNNAIQRLADTNDTISRELADSNAQLIALQRVS